jgi:hypothetical protein
MWWGKVLAELQNMDEESEHPNVSNLRVECHCGECICVGEIAQIGKDGGESRGLSRAFMVSRGLDDSTAAGGR